MNHLRIETEGRHQLEHSRSAGSCTDGDATPGSARTAKHKLTCKWNDGWPDQTAGGARELNPRGESEG